ncbi:hypothetical protein N7520_011767 [Penicillium odoratum]|uniref:uncharacterized protein n=1 Tax=Penicillium odoratum TaxID=1167516 RepID=UPI0025473D4C|nr:uncharacterized protein N7520_011767 [Penicillium odoratum]KAJ5746585.1 hypothetical protein N7520_011767 [Penicillium odoratum]
MFVNVTLVFDDGVKLLYRNRTVFANINQHQFDGNTSVFTDLSTMTDTVRVPKHDVAGWERSMRIDCALNGTAHISRDTISSPQLPWYYH